MKNAIGFVGLSGTRYRFEAVRDESDWAARSGVVVFAARGAYGWITIRTAVLRGRADDLSAIWAWREARRYGASAIFLREAGSAEREHIHADLSSGLRPVINSGASLAA
jgi:hypothetical protein